VKSSSRGATETTRSHRVRRASARKDWLVFCIHCLAEHQGAGCAGKALFDCSAAVIDVRLLRDKGSRATYAKPCLLVQRANPIEPRQRWFVRVRIVSLAVSKTRNRFAMHPGDWNSRLERCVCPQKARGFTSRFSSAAIASNRRALRW
jgi:hypothetical protein